MDGTPYPTRSTPDPTCNPNLMTPIRKEETPYAGPAFLASPAASSLHSPRWTSKRIAQKKQVEATEANSSPSPSRVLRRSVSSTLPPKISYSTHTRNTTEESNRGSFQSKIDNQKSPSTPRQELHSAQQPPTPPREPLRSGTFGRVVTGEEEAQHPSLATSQLLWSPASPASPYWNSADHSVTADLADLRKEENLVRHGTPPPLALAKDEETREASYHGNILASPRSAELEVMISPQHPGSPSLSGQKEKPPSRGCNGSEEEPFSHKISLASNLSDPFRTSPAPITQPPHRCQPKQLLLPDIMRSLISEIKPKAPARSQSSPSNFHEQADFTKTPSSTNSSDIPTRPESSYQVSDPYSPAHWNPAYCQYGKNAPFVPSVLSLQGPQFNLGWKTVQDPEVARSLHKYLQSVNV